MTEPGTPPDQIVTALGAILFGSCLGGAAMTAGTLTLRAVQGGAEPNPDQAFAVLSVGVAAGLVLAVASAFLTSRPVGDLWRRAVTGAIAVFGAVILSVLALPIDLATGRLGLSAFLALQIVVAGWAFRQVRAGR